MKQVFLLTIFFGTFLTPADQPAPAGQPDENGSIGVTSEKFTFKVVDQDNKPVKGAMIELRSSIMVDLVNVNGPVTRNNVVRTNVLSDDQGKVRIGPVRGQTYEASLTVMPKDFQNINDQQGFAIQSGKTNGLAKGPDNDLDYLFHVIDMRKEPKLTLWEASTKAIPADASSWSWNTLAPFHSGGPSSEWTTRSDFQISCWRDPKAPLLIKYRLSPQLPESNFPNGNCNWKITIKATRGLIKFIEKDKSDFLKIISYEYKPIEKRAEEGDAYFRFIWQITQGESKKFALVIFHIDQNIPLKDPKATFEINAQVAFNLNGDQSFGSVTDKLKSYAWVTQLESDDPQRNVMAEMIDASK